MKKILIFALTGMISTPLLGQDSATIAPIRQIMVSSHGEVAVVPDRASIQISVQTRAATAAAAATENAKKQTAVIDALKALGISARDIGTSGYNVYPEQRYEQNQEPVITGYNVTNTLSVQLKSVDLVGMAIDVSLAKGANMINSLQFYSSTAAQSRQEAIRLAIQSARSDADAAARAAGGTIVGLLEINVGAYSPPPPRPMMRAVAGMEAASTPITPGDLTISVDVSTRWQFVAR